MRELRYLSVDARGRRGRQATSHLSSSSHTTTQARGTHTSGVGWVSHGGKGAGEFVIVIARRGRAAIAITPRCRSYRPAGLLASATRTYVPTYLRSYSSTPPTPFRPTDSYFRATWRHSPSKSCMEREVDNDR